MYSKENVHTEFLTEIIFLDSFSNLHCIYVEFTIYLLPTVDNS